MKYLKVVGAKIDERTYQRIEELAKKLELNKSELIRIFIEIGTAVLEKGDYSDRRIVISAPISVTVNTGPKIKIDRETMRTLIEWLEVIASKATDYPQGLKTIATRALPELQKILDILDQS
jgi:hypothetical protein